MTPFCVAPHSNRKVWWVCSGCGKSHLRSVNNHVKGKPSCCRFCSKRIINPDSILTVKCPHISKQWHPTKNDKRLPSDFAYRSAFKAWWLCDKCGESWDAVWSQTGRFSRFISFRVQSSGWQSRAWSLNYSRSRSFIEHSDYVCNQHECTNHHFKKTVHAAWSMSQPYSTDGVFIYRNGYQKTRHADHSSSWQNNNPMSQSWTQNRMFSHFSITDDGTFRWVNRR